MPRFCTRRVSYGYAIIVALCVLLSVVSLRSFSTPAEQDSRFSHVLPHILPHLSPSSLRSDPSPSLSLATIPSTTLATLQNVPTSSNPGCDVFAKSAGVQVIVKTGANEIYEKLPTQLLTSLRCYEDLLIFSDLEQRIGPHHVHDALDNVTESVKLDNPDFDYYRTLQEYQKNGQDLGTLKGGDAAWNLDRYKFLHMLEKTWRMRPDRDWYVFIEADTYMVRSNLLIWLARLDPSKPLYLGSPTFVGADAFAHGGSGIILSKGAMAKFFEGGPASGVAASYDETMKLSGLGDHALMKALRDKGVEFSHRWPMLQAEKPTTIPFGPGPDNGVRHWCQPIVTTHHITPDEASTIWQFEQRRATPQVRHPLPT